MRLKDLYIFNPKKSQTVYSFFRKSIDPLTIHEKRKLIHFDDHNDIE